MVGVGVAGVHLDHPCCQCRLFWPGRHRRYVFRTTRAMWNVGVGVVVVQQVCQTGEWKQRGVGEIVHLMPAACRVRVPRGERLARTPMVAAASQA